MFRVPSWYHRPVDEELPLRARKQRRTRDAIIDTAMTLFGERGFDGVTVNEIAARAEIGRTTFFRYFSDKQEVLFADDEELLAAMTETLDAAAREKAPIGDSLEVAIDLARTGLRGLTDLVLRRASWLPLRQELIDAHPALTARSLAKERQYAQSGVEVLVGHGATLQTAALAVGIANACYQTAVVTTRDAPEKLPAAVDAAFGRLATLDTTTMRPARPVRRKRQ
jgi:AcrR family transcriptional regulator